MKNLKCLFWLSLFVTVCAQASNTSINMVSCSQVGSPSLVSIGIFGDTTAPNDFRYGTIRIDGESGDLGTPQGLIVSDTQREDNDVRVYEGPEFKLAAVNSETVFPEDMAVSKLTLKAHNETVDMKCVFDLAGTF